MTNKRENKMILRTGEVAGLPHVRPAWADPPDGMIADELRRWLVDRRIAERLDEAHRAHLARRSDRPGSIRRRVGRAITGIGERVAGGEPEPRVPEGPRRAGAQLS